MRVIYAQEAFPNEISCTVFLMGPTPRSGQGGSSWRPEALRVLEELDFQGQVFVPEPRDGRWADNYDDQVAWEEEALHRSDRILVWLAQEMSCLPGLTTNDEWGYWKGRDPARLLLGTPPAATRVRYQHRYAGQLGVPVFSDLAEACRAAAADRGERRQGGECQVPLHVWRTDAFQRWYAAQKQAGNVLCGARVEWVYRPGGRSVLFWALGVDLFVAAESRHKSNEVVLARPDLSAVVLFRPSLCLLETEVVLVRELRSSARTPDAFVTELPGGSAHDPGQGPAEVAVEELLQEIGLPLAPHVLHRHCARQQVGPLATHQAVLFSAQVSPEVIAEVRKREAARACYGVAADTERTYPCVRTVQEVLADPSVDWSTLGMILAVLQDRLQLT